MSRAADLFELTMLRLLRRAPVDWAPAIARHLVARNIRRNLTHIAAGARRNLALLRPEASAEALDGDVETFIDNVGRQMGEYATVERLIGAGRVEVVGHDHAEAAFRHGGTLFIGLHLGNWELLGAALGHFGGGATLIYDPPANDLHHDIVRDIRARMGMRAVPPGVVAARRALKALEAGTPVLMLPDEARAGLTMGPLFGRTPHRKGNLAVAVRLARATNAAIIVCHAIRLGRASRFRLTWEPLEWLPEPAGTIEDDVAWLNARIEPIIRANAEQWYFLDDDFQRKP